MRDGVHCANCQRQIDEAKERLVDEITDDTFCDRACFNDWAADNATELAAYYAKLNVRVEN